MAEESRMKRLRIGDKVYWEDASEFPPVQYEGPVSSFENEEMTYLKVSLEPLGEQGEAQERVLTEDELTRVA